MKRSRTSNFNKEEELILLEEVKQVKNVIECKLTNKLTNNEKEAAWQVVLSRFNTRTITPRTVDQLKVKYDNLKSKARRQAAQQLQERQGMGGGLCNVDELDGVSKAVLELLNATVSDTDSDNASNIVSSPSSSNSEKVDLIDIHYNNLPNNKLFDVKILDIVLDPTVVSQPCIKSEQKEDLMAPKEQNCSNVPSELKTNKNKKLKRTIPNPALNAQVQYYKRKLELLEDEHENRNRREEEEHRLKMMILQYEIEIKKKQL